MKVIVDNKIPFIREAIESIADEVVYCKGSDFTAEDVKDADALIIRTRTRCDRQLLQGSQVKYIATATIGFDHMDLNFLKEAGITWKNCPGCNAESVGQYIRNALILLEQAGKIDRQNSKLGIIGAGHVGIAVAKAVAQLGIPVLFNDPPREAEQRGDGFQSTPLEQIQKECNLISFHTPLVMQGDYPTYHLADKEFIQGLRPDCILMNTSRGAVVDNQALLEALNEGKICDAVIDTWEQEPNISLELLQRVFIGTPHIAGYSADGKANATRMALEGLCHFFNRPFPSRIAPPELPEELLPDPHADWEIQALQLYNPFNDSKKLKKNPECFEDLRGNYPLRREKVEI